jgi:hypothetical protein
MNDWHVACLVGKSGTLVTGAEAGKEIRGGGGQRCAN